MHAPRRAPPSARPVAQQTPLRLGGAGQKTPALQAKPASLALSTPGDRFEREADQAADQVLAGSARPRLTPLATAPLQREDDKPQPAPTPLGEGLATVGKNLGENNPAFSLFTEKLAARFLAQPAPISVGVPAFLGANYAFLWGMALIAPAMRRSFDDFNLAMLPGLVPQFPVKTFQYRILDSAQTRFAFDLGLDASKLMEAFNAGVLNTRVSSLKFDTGGKLDTNGPQPLALSSMQVQLGLFGDGVLLSGGFRNGISPYPLMGNDGARVMAQTPALPDLYANQRDVRFTLQLDLLKLAAHFGGSAPAAPRAPEQVQRAAADAAPVVDGMGPDAGAALQSTLAAGGAPLDSRTRRFMEQRFGHDFGRVRIHADSQAAASAHAVQARAYTLGQDVVFGRGQYAPATGTGRRLLAHELAHVVQQSGGHNTVQRELLSAKDLDDFETDAFAESVLTTYLQTHGPGRIEDDGDSDDKARRIVRLWKDRQAPFTALTAEQKILLIQEMQSGYTGNDDERGILALLLDAPAADLATVFATIDPNDLDSDFQGDEEDTLRDFYDRKFSGGRKAALAGQRSLKLAKADEPQVQAPDPFEPAKAPGPPRQDYVFIMGTDKPGKTFYRDAQGFFKAHRPKATIVADKRSLSELLRYVADKIKAPIGNLYLVSHANEDGTLMFGLDARDADGKLNATELRKALHPADGSSALAQVGPQVDQYTVVRIKGCDLGRNGDMLDLLDEAFGGSGTVIAPTHEQTYGTDPKLAERAGAEFARGDADFKAKLDARFPEPPAIDKSLKGKDLAAAQKARAKALAQRRSDIAAAQQQHEAERRAAIAKGESFEGFSGPMFQRPGDTKFTAAELKPQLKSLYGHLSDSQRDALAERLVKDDPRSEAQAKVDTTYGQQGQRVYRHEFTEEGSELANASEFLAAQRATPEGVAAGFKLIEFTETIVEPKGGKGVRKRHWKLTGSLPDGSTQTYDMESKRMPTLEELAQTARGSLNNPAKYEWTQERQHDAAGYTRLRVSAKRVLAYLHHASLDAAPQQHFTRPESDPVFHAKSRFTPPQAPKP